MSRRSDWKKPVRFLILGGLLFLVRIATQRAPALSGAAAPGDEELLYREAVASGLDRGSEVVNQRLIDNMRFLEGGEAKGRDGGKLYNEAVALGFDRTDPVVRRVLVEQMRLVAEAAGKPEAPTEVELADYLRRHQKRFRQPGQVRLSHVFLDADRRGAALESDARRLLARLQAGPITPDAAPALGDPFLPGHHPALATPRDLAKIYGPAFARAVAGLPAGRWLGPVPSTYGLHLVWIHDSVPGAPATLAEVRNQVVLGLANERREARLAAFLRNARPSPPAPLPAPPALSPGEGRQEAPEIRSEVAP
jgi:parvulin-like peptidyl-prolyl isomerase